MAPNGNIPPARAKGPDDLKWARAFIAALAKTGSPAKAAKAAKVSYPTPYKLRKRSPEFGVLWKQAKLQFADRLRAEAMSRAVDGWLEPVFQQGRRVGQIRRKSDQILLAMLKANCKEYRERVDISGVIELRVKEIAQRMGLDEKELLEMAEAIANGRETP